MYKDFHNIDLDVVKMGLISLVNYFDVVKFFESFSYIIPLCFNCSTIISAYFNMVMDLWTRVVICTLCDLVSIKDLLINFTTPTIMNPALLGLLGKRCLICRRPFVPLVVWGKIHAYTIRYLCLTGLVRGCDCAKRRGGAAGSR